MTGDLLGDNSVGSGDSLEPAMKVYNDAAQRQGWPQARYLTDTRRRALKRSIKDCGGPAGWEGAILRAERSSFLTGKTGRNGAHASWRPSLDFFIRPAALIKLLEGGYDDPPAVPIVNPEPYQHPAMREKRAAFVPESAAVRLRGMLASYERLGMVGKAAKVRAELAALGAAVPPPAIDEAPPYDGIPEGDEHNAGAYENQ